MLNDATKEMVELWRQNPSIACNDLLHHPLSDDPDERYELIAPQRIIANRVWYAKSAIVIACRGFGKTRMAATLAILQAWLYPGRRIGCLSASFRQAKQIFDEIIRIWERSPLLQQSTTRRPIISNDMCRLDFRPIPGRDGSTIRALPLADGSKIRGQRFHTIFVDEAVHVPEDVFNLVIRPMAATHQNPVQAMRIEREKEKIREMNLPADIEAKKIKELEEYVGANRIVMLTSGYYSFNYVYKLYCKYAQRMHGIFETATDELDLMGENLTDDPDDYAAFQIPWDAIPKGFLDQRGLVQAKRDMSPLQFRMEYEAAWILDTGGFFKASDIEACRANNLGLFDHYVVPRGFPERQYVLGIDPGRTRDAFAMVVMEFDPTFGGKIVHAEQYFKDDAAAPKMVRRIFELSNLFNFIRIAVDKGGGGLGIVDYLAQDPGDGSLRLFDMENDEYRGLTGRHIVKLTDFNSTWIEAAHHNVLNLLHRRQLSFPAQRLDEHEGENDMNTHAVIQKMINQILSIQVSETKLGRRPHFDLPETGGAFEQHKDLYSAFLIAGDIVYNLLQVGAMPQRRMVQTGIVTPRHKFFEY
jgi:hypothetical protein